MTLPENNKSGLSTNKKLAIIVLGIVVVIGIISMTISASNIVEEIDLQEEIQNQVEQPTNQVTPYTIDECQFYIENLDSVMSIYNGRNNMIQDEQEKDIPDTERINRLIRDNENTQTDMENSYGQLIVRGCLDPENNKYINK